MRLSPLALAATLLATLSLGACSSGDTAASLAPVGAPTAMAVSVPGAPRGTAPDPVAPSGALALAAPVVSAAPAAANAAIAATRLRVAPVMGAPAGALGPLSRAMGERGREIGLDFARGGATHTLNGFFSVNDDGREVRVVYIWDVVDASGRRVHRMRGQEIVPGTRGGRDPWGAVNQATMQRIGRETVDRFATWRGA